MAELEAMVRLAREALHRAHAPYSGFPVGACVRGESGRLYSGCNVENASFPEGWCAETSAIAALVGAGERQILEVLVLATSAGLCAPCGGCRQRLSEFAAADTPVHLLTASGLQQTVTLGELLPLSFGREQLLAPAAAASGAVSEG